MAGHKWGRRSLELYSLVASVAFLAVVNGSVVKDPTNLPVCQQRGQRTGKSQFLMLVSTLDGKLTVLNANKHGVKEWSMNTGSGPLLSSSISKLELQRNGMIIRLIPSLDGGLYQYDGVNINALPFTADTLLSSSHKLSEDSIVVGGKETRTYGVDVKTGKIQYICSMSGCEVCGNNAVTEHDDIVVIRRNTQTVRAVDIRTGQEKWNFSVGEHELEFLEGIRPMTAVDEDDDVTITTCTLSGEEIHDDPPKQLDDFDLKVLVPSGLVVAVKKSNPNEIVWQHKFDHPIANVWSLIDGELEKMSLFDLKYIRPGITRDDDDDNNDFQQPTPSIYLGVHQNQMYVQPGRQTTKDDIRNQDTCAAMETCGNMVHIPRLHWRPYLASASSRTPHLNNRPLIDYDHPKDSVVDSEEEEVPTVWQENDYPYDNGYYVFSDGTTLPDHRDWGLFNLTKSGELSGDDSIAVSLWNWWKEVLAMVVIVAVVVHLITVKKMMKHIEYFKSKSEKNSESTDSSNSIVESKQDIQPNGDYVSRYYTDFEPIQCLGKGGFGVVFQVRNKMDDCSYAIKRIALPNSETAKEKVMREVKALAKLDHPGIVRYFQAWFECPPAGWQEERDKTYMEDSDFTSTTYTHQASDQEKVLCSQERPSPHGFGGLDSIVELSNTTSPRNITLSSEGFIPHLDDLDESGSFSAIGTPAKSIGFSTEESVEIIFERSESENSLPSGAMDVPFNSYLQDLKQIDEEKLKIEDSNDSFNIIFEDSGCEKSKSTNSDSVFLESKNSESSESTEKCSGDAGKHFKLNTSERGHKSNSPKSESHATWTSSIQTSNKTVTEYKNQNNSCKNQLKLYLYIQMQLCRTESLKDWLNNNTLNRDRHQMLDIFEQIISAVDYVHDCGLMHRDLKPSNIFFAMDGAVKVGDFGLVTAMTEHSDDENSGGQNNPHNKHTDQVGTQLYMSPEQIAGQAYSHKVDIYSLGLIFFELLYPFTTQMERVSTLLKVKNGTLPDRFARELVDESTFVRQLLAPNPDDRPTVKEIMSTPLMVRFEEHQIKFGHRRGRSRTVSSSSST